LDTGTRWLSIAREKVERGIPGQQNRLYGETARLGRHAANTTRERHQRFAKRSLGRRELKRFADWDDGRPETELNFKFYRQATNKIIGISDEAAAFLEGFF